MAQMASLFFHLQGPKHPSFTYTGLLPMWWTLVILSLGS